MAFCLLQTILLRYGGIVEEYGFFGRDDSTGCEHSDPSKVVCSGDSVGINVTDADMGEKTSPASESLDLRICQVPTAGSLITFEPPGELELR